MKKLEKKLWRFCCKQLDYNCKDISNLKIRNNLYSFHIIDQFCDLNNCSLKQVRYYFEKWERLGIFKKYYCTIYSGDFNFSNLPIQYILTIPSRVYRKHKALPNTIEEMLLMNKFQGRITINV